MIAPPTSTTLVERSPSICAGRSGCRGPEADGLASVLIPADWWTIWEKITSPELVRRLTSEMRPRDFRPYISRGQIGTFGVRIHSRRNPWPLSCWSRLLTFLICFISRPNHCYWEWNVCLNIKICEYICAQIKKRPVIFSHLKLWVAVARHNFKWVTI